MTTKTHRIGNSAELIRLLGDFNRTLELEQKSLLELEADQLITVTERKQMILDRIAQIDEHLMDRITGAAETDEGFTSIEKIRQLIDSCREQNRENSVMVAQGLKITRNAIGFLNNTVQQQSIELYSATGQSRAELSSRKLGEA